MDIRFKVITVEDLVREEEDLLMDLIEIQKLRRAIARSETYDPTPLALQYLVHNESTRKDQEYFVQ